MNPHAEYSVPLVIGVMSALCPSSLQHLAKSKRTYKNHAPPCDGANFKNLPEWVEFDIPSIQEFNSTYIHVYVCMCVYTCIPINTSYTTNNTLIY